MSHGIDVSTITPESIEPPVVARAAWPLEQDISLVGALNTVLRRAPVVFGLPLVAALLTVRVDGRSLADSLARGVKRLDELIAVRVDVQTSIVRVSVDTRDPGLAAAVANRLVEYLNEFNTHKRQSQARERRRFSEERV